MQFYIRFEILNIFFLVHVLGTINQANVKLELEIGKYDRREDVSYITYFLKRVWNLTLSETDTISQHLEN